MLPQIQAGIPCYLCMQQGVPSNGAFESLCAYGSGHGALGYHDVCFLVVGCGYVYRSRLVTYLPDNFIGLV